MPKLAILWDNVMSWSWYNPSPEEAAEAYSYYSNKYVSAAYEKNLSERKERECVNARNHALGEIESLYSEKKNMEKRLEGVIDLIKMMEGKGSFFSADVPSSISKAQKALNRTDESYHSSVVLSGGGSASLTDAFEIKTVEGDPRTASVLQAFRAEQKRLEAEIENIKKRLQQLLSEVTELSKKIQGYNVTQARLQRSMNSYAYEMNHYKKYTY